MSSASLSDENFFWKKRRSFLNTHQSHPTCLHLSTIQSLVRTDTDSVKRLIEMSSSNTFTSSQATLNNEKPQVGSKNDHRDWKSPTAGLQNQHKDATQSEAKVSEPESIEQVATPRTSTSGPSLDNDKVHDVCRASTAAGTKQSVYACEPCECRKLRCDGMRPMCNNCEMNGRRCFYE